MKAGTGPAQIPAGQHHDSCPALNLYQSGTGQCWARLGGPKGDKIVLPVGTGSGTAPRAVLKPEVMTCTFSCRINAGLAIVWGGSSGTGRQRPQMCKCRPQSGLLRYVERHYAAMHRQLNIWVRQCAVTARHTLWPSGSTCCRNFYYYRYLGST
jgi:hypothetical protein